SSLSNKTCGIKPPLRRECVSVTKFMLSSSQPYREPIANPGAPVMSFRLPLQDPRNAKNESSRCWGCLLTLALLLCGCASGGSGGPKPIVQPPSITTQPTNEVVAVGQTATFSAQAGGTPPLNYQWSKNGAAISGATS